MTKHVVEDVEAEQAKTELREGLKNAKRLVDEAKSLLFRDAPPDAT